MSTIEELQSTVAGLNQEITAVHKDTDVIHDYVWLLANSFLVLTMQAGFALYESSLIRSKNMHNVLLKNIMDGAVGAIFWLAIGYGIAYGSGDPFVGKNYYFGVGIDGSQFAFFLFQYSFAATASTIMSGALAERVNFYSYTIMCGFINSVIYAFVAHWVWQEDGWLYKWGFFDFAGCGVVHMVGGFAGLAGAIFLGPRIGKFEFVNGKKVTNQIPMSNPSMAVLGVFILGWGWFGFNGGSTLAVSNGWYKVAGITCINTALSSAGGATGGLIYSIIMNRKEHYVDILDVANGILAGLIGITAAAPVVPFGIALLIGAMSSWIILSTGRLVEKLQLFDDPVGAFSMHGVGGMCGLLFAGLFADGKANSYSKFEVTGAFYGDWAQLGKQLTGLVVIAVWSFTLAYALCYIVDRFLVKLRVPAEVEKIGMDIMEHRLGYKRDGRTTFDEYIAQSQAQSLQSEKDKTLNAVYEQLDAGFTKVHFPESTVIPH